MQQFNFSLVAAGIDPAYFEGFRGFIEGCHPKFGVFDPEGDGNTATSCPDVENMVAGFCKPECPFCQLLGLAAGDQHPGPDQKGAAVEPPFPENILHRLMGCNSFDGEMNQQQFRFTEPVIAVNGCLDLVEAQFFFNNPFNDQPGFGCFELILKRFSVPGHNVGQTVGGYLHGNGFFGESTTFMANISQMEELEKPVKMVTLVAGEQGSGKSLLMAELWQEAVRCGIMCGGFLAPGYWNENQRSGFDLKLVHSGLLLPFCRDADVPGWMPLRRFFFSPEALHQGEAEIRSLFNKPVGLWLIDEIGPIELQGGLWHDVFSELIRTTTAPVVVSMRPSLVDDICHYFNISKWNQVNPADQPLSAGELFQLLLTDDR